MKTRRDEERADPDFVAKEEALEQIDKNEFYNNAT